MSSMRCRTVQRKLSAFLDGEVPEKMTSQITEHLSGCPACREEAASLSAVWKGLEEMREIDPSPYFWTRLNARIAQAERRRFSPDRVWRMLSRTLVPVTGVTAAVIGLWIGGALYDVYQPDRTDEWDQVASALYLDTLDDFPAQSIGSAYMELVSDQVQ